MTNEGIHKICRKYGIKNYTINDGFVNVKGSVYLSNKGLTKLPLRFGKIKGTFWCNNNELRSLDGAPVKVGGDFNCYNNKKELSYERYLNKMNRLKKLKELDVG